MNLTDNYAKAIIKRPVITLLIALIIIAFAASQAGNVNTQDMNYDNMLPEHLEAMQGITYLQDHFQGADVAYFVIELDPAYTGSDEPRDILDPRIITYSDLLTSLAERTSDVASASSPGSIIKEANNGVIPKDLQTIKTLETQLPQLQSSISEDNTMLLVTIRLEDERDDAALLTELQNIMETVPRPAGTQTSIGGSALEQPITQELIGPDMSRTSKFSLIGIVIILLILFGSIRYSVIPLTVIGVGTLLTFGFLGAIGLNISSASSGAISMIMGIGIDFGIQIVNRFKQERKNQEAKTAMHSTINAVMKPMLTTTLAALIGFKAMSMGQLTFMQELGNIMSYGVVACFIVAITIVPALLILTEKRKEGTTP